MVNTETLETLGKQEWSIQKHWKHWATKNGQYRNTGNIGQPRMVNTETLETLGKQEWSIQTNVSSVFVLTIFSCPMFPVSLY
jgi:hypothetical protein